MKKPAVFSAVILAFICSSCAVTIQRHGSIHDKDLAITLEDGCKETGLFSVEHENYPDGNSFRLSMPFFGINVYEDRWRGERYIDIDLFR